MRRIAAFVVAVVAVLLVVSLSPASAQSTTRPAGSGAGASQQPKKTDSAKVESGRTIPLKQTDAKRALMTRLPETRLDDVRLDDAIDFLRDASGANIHVNWRALESVNITRETPVTVRMSPMPLRNLLKYVLTEADGQNLATFYPDDGVIEVTTRELADRRMITKVYPVEDLLLTIPDFTDPPNFQIQQQRASGGGGGGGGGQSLLGSGSVTQDENTQVAKTARGQELVQLVMDTVQPDVWRENGGTASIRFFRGRLIVTAPPSVHEQIGGAVE